MEMDRITGQPQAVRAVVCKIATLSLALSIVFHDLSSLISYKLSKSLIKMGSCCNKKFQVLLQLFGNLYEYCQIIYQM